MGGGGGGAKVSRRTKKTLPNKIFLIKTQKAHTYRHEHTQHTYPPTPLPPPPPPAPHTHKTTTQQTNKPKDIKENNQQTDKLSQKCPAACVISCP